MNYIHKKIENYNLYIIPTDKFKTISMSIHLRREDTKEDILYRRLLRKMLLAGTSKYKNIKEYNKAKMNLYNPYIDVQTTVYGQDRSIILISQFPHEKYTEKNMNKKTISFILEMLYNPKIKNNTFDEETFEIIKHEYIEDLKAIKDIPSKYAKERLWEEMNLEKFDKLKINERINLAKTITSSQLYEYYKSLFEKDSLDIFIIGNVNDEIIPIIKEKIKGNFQEKSTNTPIVSQIKKKPKEIIEVFHTNQSSLLIGLKIDKMTDFEYKYVFTVYTNILGGSWNSKLMQVVREQNSLCYTIYSTKDSSTSSAYIYAGIDAKNFEKTYELIKKQISSLEKGSFTEESINQVKQLYNNALMEIEDNQISIMNNLISEKLSHTDSISERKKQINKVTKDDIISFAKKVHYDTIYLLKGEQKNE